MAMAIAGPHERLRAIDELLAPHGYISRLLGARRPTVYICEPLRVLEARPGGVAVAVDGAHPLRTLDPDECVWDVLANRIAVSPAYMLAKMFAATEAGEAERRYAAEQASAELYEAAQHMDKLHIAIPRGDS